MANIDHFDRLYGERASQPDAEFLFSELLETRSSSFEWNIKPHIHPRLYQLFFVEKGRFTIYETENQKTYNGPCLLLVPPTILHGFIYETGTTGRILSISDALVESMLSDANVLAQLLRNLQIVDVFGEDNSLERIRSLIEAIDTEFLNRCAERQLMLKLSFQQLLLIIYRLVQLNKAVRSHSDPVALVYFRKFQQLLRTREKSKTISKLAGELNITPEHLNRICNQISGKSASCIVQEYLLDEAYKYLIYTSYSVSEIAYRLNFEYPNYFSRFFRKHTGLSPIDFRKQKLQQHL